ncbi:hypothetical protein GNI_049500 [Gregarina niphandrodes]|uniref:Uncharacterized protein n=1 Tax=Gregarina niphandrodes TaxID=110365 RepID=A0A023B9I8_GRENI|nr:hypothetical protein GNI_049500 [Gregarina niphandrodes]EZG72973.1 hypothetical protein GNI_049500 [Gregarina niphandrodes]|eukprot:XP_011129668.1 hypothetical protein GNI_049500 [Gregarina niphandrodes]
MDSDIAATTPEVAAAINFLEQYRDLTVQEFLDKFFDEVCCQTQEKSRELMRKFGSVSEESKENSPNPPNERS